MGITWKHILQIKTIELKFYIILTEYYEIMKSVINIQRRKINNNKWKIIISHNLNFVYNLCTTCKIELRNIFCI
ncbi:LOW QUALITY PROTEIN: hypothetical protein PFMALIP_03101 [Plasmodium falciparum MaliPS096_E11]|uniref:Uncharacterized protein n=1 Tax=Plasmodium falciparum MaliPS096_E11 TaxID=1036727 RepID=A0A024WPF6_PLAFA|nr:LOW QUALITY PROTEIN: hypothetical protein PFMALIP_03101 [Plasmodium falciparum MaliPS096_E11]